MKNPGKCRGFCILAMTQPASQALYPGTRRLLFPGPMTNIEQCYTIVMQPINARLAGDFQVKQLDTLCEIVFPALFILIGLLAIAKRSIYLQRGGGRVTGVPAVAIGVLILVIGISLYGKTLPGFTEPKTDLPQSFTSVSSLFCFLPPLAVLYALFSIGARLARSSEKSSKAQVITIGAVIILCVAYILIIAALWSI